MQGNSARSVVVGPGGTGVVAHVGLHAICRFADRIGLTAAFSAAVPWRGERAPLHDRGTLLVHQMAVLAGGGESCADIEHLRAEPTLFGAVASDSTVWRAFHEITPATRDTLVDALGATRRSVWSRLAHGGGDDPVILDVDASLVPIHTEEKEGTGPNYKGGWGFHPLFVFSDLTGECLSSMLRPGNANAGTVADHLELLDAAIAQLPTGVAAGHRSGDDAGLVGRELVVRSDSAGCSEGFLSGCRERNVTFSVVARRNAQIEAAIFDAVGLDEVWTAAIDQDGEMRQGAAVCELTSLVDLSRLPSGTRLIVRREPLHPGAQRSLFPSLDYRYWGFYTDRDGDPVALDQEMRAHAHVEEHIGRLKDSGLLRFPFSSLEANRSWLFLVTAAADLVRWFQLLCLDGALAVAHPKALRWSLFSAPGRVVRSARREIVRVLDHWPAVDTLLGAYRRIALIT
jgi:hypothetical protein